MRGRDIPTSSIIIWQSKVPFPRAVLGRATWGRSLDTTGAPKVMLGTKWPSMISIWSLHISRIERLALTFWEREDQGEKGISFNLVNIVLARLQ